MQITVQKVHEEAIIVEEFKFSRENWGISIMLKKIYPNESIA